jgi:hypothetical protein
MHAGVVWLDQFGDAREGDPPLGTGGGRVEGRVREYGVWGEPDDEEAGPGDHPANPHRPSLRI